MKNQVASKNKHVFEKNYYPVYFTADALIPSNFMWVRIYIKNTVIGVWYYENIIVSASNYCAFFEKTFLNLFFLIAVWCTAVWPMLREEKNIY